MSPSVPLEERVLILCIVNDDFTTETECLGYSLSQTHAVSIITHQLSRKEEGGGGPALFDHDLTEFHYDTLLTRQSRKGGGREEERARLGRGGRGGGRE